MIENIFKTDMVRDVFTAWNLAKGSSDGLPKRKEFDPLECLKSLSSVWIYELKDGDYECVLAGEEINSAWQTSTRRKKIIEIVGESKHESITKRFNYVLSNKCIAYGYYQSAGKSFVTAERFYAPMTDEQGRAVYVLGVSNYRFLKENQDPITNYFLSFYDAKTYELVKQENV